MIRVLLIDLGSPRQERNEPIGIDTLAAVLMQRFRSKVDIRLSYSETDADAANEMMTAYRPNLIGISTKIGTFQALGDTIRQIVDIQRERPPLIVVGGTLATYAFEGVLRTFPETICVIGEGEDALSGLVALLVDNGPQDLSTIKEWCKSQGIPNTALTIGESVLVNSRQCINLEEVPSPTRSFVKTIMSNGGLVRIEGSRGCPWSQCTFCGVAHKYNSSEWRPFPIDRVLREIEQLNGLGVRKIYFTDEDFVGPDPARAIALCEGIVRMKAKEEISKELSFFISTSVRSLLQTGKPIEIDKCLLKNMSDAGFDEIFVGIESGSPSQLKRYNKNYSEREARECIAALRDRDFHVDIGFIMFDPEMTLNDLKVNLSFCMETGIYDGYARLSKRVRLTPFTPLTKRLQTTNSLPERVSIDDAAFDYEFFSEPIAAIQRIYNTWEDEYLPVAYQLQTTLRGENDIDSRHALIQQLSWLRRMDYNFLNECVAIAETAQREMALKLRDLYLGYADKLRQWTGRRMASNNGFHADAEKTPRR